MNWKSPNAPGERDKQTANKKNTPTEENPEADRTPLTNTQTPPAQNTEATCKYCYKPPHWGWKVLEGFAFVAAIAYAVLTYFMWDDSHNNFTIDERAWLSAVMTVPGEIKEGTPLQGIIVLHNTGKTAARKIVAECTVSIQRNNDIVPLDYSGSHTVSDMGMLAPNAFTDATPCVMGKVEEPQKISKNQADDLLNGRAYLAEYGRGKWVDIFGGVHWVQFCTWRWYYSGTGTYDAQSCTDYNDTGDGIPPSWTPKKN